MTSSLDSILSKIPACFDRAKDSGDLLFYPSTVQKQIAFGAEFEIRICPALKKKPGSETSTQRVHSPDPFLPPYNPNLLIGTIKNEEGEEYVLLLNKYAVVPQHIILAPTEYRSQASPLLPSDLVQVYSLLFASQRHDKHYFAFYNCGGKSGASQPHKHIQFLPRTDKTDPPIECLAKEAVLEVPDKAFSLTNVPYANFVVRFPPSISSMPLPDLEQTLSQVYISLLDLVITTVRQDPNHPAGMPSYNVLMTLSHMHVIPRSCAGYVLPQTNEEIPVNSLGFAGMLLVKSEEELEALKTEGIDKVLRGVAVDGVDHSKFLD